MGPTRVTHTTSGAGEATAGSSIAKGTREYPFRWMSTWIFRRFTWTRQTNAVQRIGSTTPLPVPRPDPEHPTNAATLRDEMPSRPISTGLRARFHPPPRATVSTLVRLLPSASRAARPLVGVRMRSHGRHGLQRTQRAASTVLTAEMSNAWLHSGRAPKPTVPR